jgi:hypothetical protein
MKEAYNNLLNSLRKLFGTDKEPPLTGPEKHLLFKLTANRKVCREKLVPKAMRKEFSSLFSDKCLKQTVKEVYSKQFLTKDKRGEYLKLLIAGHLGTKGFGTKLMVNHDIDPESIVRRMLGRIKV